MKFSLLCLVLLLILVACTETKEKDADENEIEEKEKEVIRVPKYKVSENDIFSLAQNEKFTGRDISVKGVMLGHSKNKVIEILGEPDNATVYEEGWLTIENMEYGKSIGLKKNGLIIHLENNIVTRITMNARFNKFLKGNTAINKTKEDIFFHLGTPDEKATRFKYIIYAYNKLGFEYVAFRGDEVGFAIVIPRETDRNISTNVTDTIRIPYAEEIVFK